MAGCIRSLSLRLLFLKVCPPLMYPLPPQGRQLCAEQLSALEVLADAGLWGCTAPTLLAYGFRITMLVNLVRNGLATARRETLRVGDRKIKAARIRITDAGQRALEGAVRYSCGN
jgi:hypothetical protein